MASKRTPLRVRMEAALRLVEAGELDGDLALSLVVWPVRGSRLEGARVERHVWPEELKAECRALREGGETIPAISRRLGVPVATCKEWLTPRKTRERPPTERVA